MNKLMRGTITLMILGFTFVSSTWALPPAETDLIIGGVVVSEPNGEPALNLSEAISLLIQGPINNGVCLNSSTLETSSTTNSFSMHYDLVGCEDVILSPLASIGQFDMFLEGIVNSSLEVSTQPGLFVEILQFTRNSPASPIMLVLENLGFPLPGDANLRVTPRVTDSQGNVLFQGSNVAASADGVGPIGGGATFTFVLDAIPEDVELQNVDRQLRLELAAVQGGIVQGQIAQLAPFPLTFRTQTGCMELLQFGPGGTPVPPTVLASVGCAMLTPPPSCLEQTSNAIATARDYKRATRRVKRHCGRKQTEFCAESLTTQSDAFGALTHAQTQVEVSCLP